MRRANHSRKAGAAALTPAADEPEAALARIASEAKVTLIGDASNPHECEPVRPSVVCNATRHRKPGVTAHFPS
jgi:hypothetical protein